jgi:hypothetical protein
MGHFNILGLYLFGLEDLRIFLRNIRCLSESHYLL